MTRNKGANLVIDAQVGFKDQITTHLRYKHWRDIPYEVIEWMQLYPQGLLISATYQSNIRQINTQYGPDVTDTINLYYQELGVPQQYFPLCSNSPTY